MRDSIAESILETVGDLRRSGVIDELTVREMQALCLPPVKPLTSSKITKLRHKLKLSQGALALLLNIHVSTMQKWEQGLKNPSGASLKLLHLAMRKGLVGLI